MHRRQKTKTIRYPYTQELLYQRNLKWMNRQLRALCKEHLASKFESMAAAAMPLKFDQDDDWLDQLNRAITKIADGMIRPVRITQEQLDNIGIGTDNFNKKQWNQLIRKAYGVNPVAEEPGKYGPKLSQWAEENARLIKNIPEKTIMQIRDQTIEALTKGTNVEDTVAAMQDILDERLDVSDSRAELIARDQVSKLNGDLTKSRQEDAGVNSYIWRTVGDERVRDSHAAVDGETFSWDAPPTETDGNHPGEDYQCRCWAEPILPDRMSFEASLVELDEAA
jgi:SPP1 gp7 family putative phage head morphogenesis protein